MPLSYWDVAVWSGMIAVVLLVTYELSPRYGGIGLPVDLSRLRLVMIALVLIFFVLLGFRVYQGFMLH
jgi:Mg2+/Co2+ transporter CorB